MPSSTYGSRAKACAALAAGALVVPVGLTLPATAADLDVDDSTTSYIVQLKDLPIGAYEGGVRGIAATKPGTGEKVNVDSADAQEYADYLTTQQNRAVRSSGASTDDVIYRYDTALNGVAITLTGQEAAAMAKAPGVLNVWESEIFTLDTTTTPDYLGLSGPDGVWNQQFGGSDAAGEGMVVGVIDSGIWPESESFAPLPAGTEIPATWNGACDNGVDADPANNVTCNNKLIGARYYDEDIEVSEAEFNSPRDYDGHGTHTAGTSAGNNAVPMSVNGIDLGEGSGMAPAAHVAAYKALWADGLGEASGSSVDLVAAIDDAVEDGVDVINYSVSGSSQFVVDPVELAFLFAADAGVFVSASAGNSGDTVGKSSVAHNSPWTTTVAASTHDRNVNKTLTLGNDATYTGVGVGEGVGPAPLVYAGDIPASGATAAEAQECWLDTDQDTDGNQLAIDPAGAAGNIVICDRGSIARVDKSKTVDEAGGVGMVLANTNSAESLNGDFHSVPTVHVNSTDGAAVKAYESSATDPTATIGGPEDGTVVAPEMAGFSSYGPALAGGGDLLKPDITAPGVDVIAAVAPPGWDGENFNSLSGTSMSAPHIAGIAALMMQEYPDWSPAAVKSAMMTTARTTNTAGDQIQRTGSDATALDYGAGEVVPAPAYDPGLVYDAGLADWFDYACSINQLQLVTQPGTCDTSDTDPSDLNYPTIAIGQLAGTQTITRTVTNVTDTAATYNSATSQAPPGLAMTVTPAVIEVPANGTATFDVTFAQVDAPLDTYTFGSLVWDGAGGTVTSQIAIQPTALATLDEIIDTGVSGSRDYDLTAGFAGDLDTDIDGLVPGVVVDVDTVKDDDTLIDGEGEFTVPADTKVLRFATFDDDVPASDIDLNIFDPSGDRVGASGTGTSAEEFTIENPDPGVWTVAVDLFSAEPSAVVPVNGFYVTDADPGNLTVTPDSATVAPSETVAMTATWSGLAPGAHYLGSINYDANGTMVDRTLVNITAAPLEVDRIAGEDRYDTAAKIALSYPEAVDTVFVSSGLSFADALSGSSAASTATVPGTLEAGNQAAPMLLTRSERLPDPTVAALNELDPDQIVILGGTKVVSPAVENALEDYGTVERIGGSDRYETSQLLAETYPEDVPVVYVASGAEAHFADALSGGALAGTQGAPVVLVRPDRVDDFTQAALDYLNADEVVVLGGPAAVSETVYRSIGADNRLWGDDRYKTAVAISNEFEGDIAATLVASGLAWPDALAGASFSGYLGQPLTLSGTNDVPDVVMTELDRLSPDSVTLLGGQKVLTQDVEDELNASYPNWVR
ncbi:MAG: cell wall-binding repeat-containing protein [Ornithinimicrobium sp.]